MIKFQPPVRRSVACHRHPYKVERTQVTQCANMGIWHSSLNDKLRETKQQVNRTIRELERQRMKYERDEATIIQKLKADAKNGRMKNLRILAKDLVRTRKIALHYSNMKSQMTAILVQLQSAQSANMLSTNLKSVNKLISKVSQNTNIVEFQKIIQSLGRESEIVNLKLDVMSESLDNTLQGEFVEHLP